MAPRHIQGTCADLLSHALHLLAACIPGSMNSATRRLLVASEPSYSGVERSHAWPV